MTQPLSDNAEDIIARFSAAEPVPMIAKDYGVSRTAIYLFITRHAPEARATRAASKAAEEAFIFEQYRAGVPVTILAQDYGRSPQRIYEIIAKKRQDA